MKAYKYLAIAIIGFVLFVGCKKELSFEQGPLVSAASGTLKDTLGNCLPIVTYGKYLRNTTLTDSNYIVVQVNFTSPGSYTIATDTVNGFSFKASGVTIDSGLQSITLKGTGKPTAPQLTNFAVEFDSTICMFSINVLDSAITTPTTSNDYFPTTDSSNWTYDLNATNADEGDTVHAQVSMTDKNISGNTYRTFALSEPESVDTNYYRKGNGLYYEYSNLNNFSFFDLSENQVEYVFLKDNVPAGSIWESPEVNVTFNNIPGKAKIMFTIEGKDIQTTIGTTTIDSVIKVKREYIFAPAPAGSYVTAITGSFYYAKNIGFIKAEGTAPLPFSIYMTKCEIRF